ncbi:unnamed protein product [Phytophthora lilii]|uniref:Rab3 GTPase-activating protein catalytic subunit n=1 Tax=Phytophthora lilii TaxID=2077276 RepID=A0A9W6TMI6_9STRA|nr:unnamed protein product [Phytophthora lilii]
MLSLADADRDFQWGVDAQEEALCTSVFEDNEHPVLSRKAALRNVQKWFGVDEFLLLSRSSPHETRRHDQQSVEMKKPTLTKHVEEDGKQESDGDPEVEEKQEVKDSQLNDDEQDEDTMADIYVDPNETGMLLSALTMALNNCNCTIPAFVPVLEPSRGAWIGSAVPGATGNVSMSFDTDSVPELNPNQSCISGLLDFFKAKLQLLPHIEETCRVEADESGDLAIGMMVSASFGYSWNRADDPRELVTPENSMSWRTLESQLPVKERHEIAQITASLFGQSPTPVLGTCISPLNGMDLTVSWPKLREGTYVDNVVHSTLDPSSAPVWMLTVRFQDLLSENQRKPQLPLSKQIANLVQVYSNSRELNKDILVSELAPPMPAVSQPPKSSTTHATTSSSEPSEATTTQTSSILEPVPASRAAVVLGNAISSLVSAATWKGSDAEEIRRIVSELFDDEEEEGGGGSENGRGGNGVSLTTRQSSIQHGAPLGELVSILATRMGQLRTSVILWQLFVVSRLDSCCLRLTSVTVSYTRNFNYSIAVFSGSIDLLRSDGVNHSADSFVHDVRSCCRAAQETKPASNAGDTINASHVVQTTTMEKSTDATALDADEGEGDIDGSPSDDEFFDSIEQDTSLPSPPRATRQSEGVLREATGVVCLQTNEPLMEPVTQTAVPMTEDVAKQQQDLLTRLGVSVESDKLRQQIQSTALISDMQAFKAANPRCCLADFIRWYSPKDWIPFKAPMDTAHTDLPAEGRGVWWFEQHGMLSERMRFGQGREHLWQHMWETSAPVPVTRQKRLFDPLQESEKIYHYMETLAPHELFHQMLAGAISSSVFALETALPVRVSAQTLPVIHRALDNLRLHGNRAIALLDEALAESLVAFPAAGRITQRGDRHAQSIAAAHQGQQLQVAFEMALDACWKLVRVLEGVEALITKALALLHYFSTPHEEPGALVLVNLLLLPLLSRRQQGEISGLLKNEALRQQIAAIMLTNPTLAEAGPMTVPVQREYVLRCISPRPFLREYYGHSALDEDDEATNIPQPDDEFEESPLVVCRIQPQAHRLTTLFYHRFMGQLVDVVKLPSDFLAGEGVAKRRDSSFSPATLHFCWLAFVTLHVFCLIYFTTFAWCYWNLPGTSLAWWFLFFHVGLGSDHDHAIAVVHGCLAAVHLIYLIWMVGWTLKKRRLVFAVYITFSRPGTSTRKLDEGWISRLRSAYCAALSKTGILGVYGPYFDLVLLGREIIETALQTQQAYRMSALLPRTELNRGYTAMLVINCWSTALVHSVYRVDATKGRLLAVVCDCALDLMTSVGITSVLLAIYSRDFDYELSGFPLSKWYEDVWVVHVLSEFQILVVKSWGDLTFRVVFAISMISDMNNIKTLLSRKVPQLKRKSKSNQQVAAVLSLDPSIGDGSESRTQRKLDVVVASEF